MVIIVSMMLERKRGGGCREGEGPKVEIIVVSMWMVLYAMLRGEGTGVGEGACGRIPGIAGEGPRGGIVRAALCRYNV